MKYLMKNFLFYVSIALSGLLIPAHIDGKQGDAPGGKSAMTPVQGNKIHYKNYIWIEGENAVATNFSKEKTYNFYCSNKYALQLSKDADPSPDKGYYASYVFQVPRTKSYDFWMACSPPGSTIVDKTGYASPIEWKIDDGQFRTASSDNTYVKEYYAPGGFYWVKISSGTLSAGQHNLTIRVKQKRSSGWDYYFYIDAMMFIPTYSGYLMPLMDFPDVSPKDFHERGSGIKFNTIDHYKAEIKSKNNYRENIFTLMQIYGWLYEYNKGIDLAESYLKDNPKDIEIRLLLASNLAWGDRLDDAIKEYKNIISIENKNITARKLLAVLAGWNNRYDEAIKNYTEIVEIDPKNVDAYISLATQLTWKGDVNKALGIFEKAESIAPNNIEVLYALGDNYNWAGNTYNSIRQYKKIISINEKEISAFKKLAKIYYDQGDNKQANEYIDDAMRIMRIYPELSGFSLDVKGEQDKEIRATIEEYNKAVAKDPEDLEARKNLIDAYRWNKMEGKAIVEYNNLLNIKALKKIESIDEKTGVLEVEIIKFLLLLPEINKLNMRLKEIFGEYKELADAVKNNRPLPERLSIGKLQPDYIGMKNLQKKLDIFEKYLSGFGDVLSYYSKDVQNFQSQKKVLKWEFDRDRVLKQARFSEKNSPEDYRHKKVIGLMDQLYGSGNEAVINLKFVNSKEPKKSTPSYILALSSAGKYIEAEENIKYAINNSKANISIINKLKELDLQLNNFKKTESSAAASDDKVKMAREIVVNSSESVKRFNELARELDEKLKSGRMTVQSLYEKGFLDLENDNVPIYREISQYYLNNNQIINALEYYYNILNVQPLNVDINFKLGSLNETAGYWKSAMNNYEVCINNQLENNLPRLKHFDLQKEYSPSVKNESEYYSEKAVKRINTGLIWDYPINDWFALRSGYKFLKVDEQGGKSLTGQFYPGIKTGEVIRHTGYARAGFMAPQALTSIYLEGYGHYYTGKVDFEQYDKYDSSLNYYTFNYAGIIKISPILKVFSISLKYMHEDLADLGQGLRLAKRDEITSNTMEGALEGAFQELDFPLSNRIFIYSNFKYRMISDSNKRTSNYDELTFRLLRFPEKDIYLDVSGIYSYENSKFKVYTVSSADDLPFLPYWAPQSLSSYGGGVRFSQTISNLMNSKLFYSLSFNYTVNSLENKNMNPGASIKYESDRLSLDVSYHYAYSSIKPTALNPDPDPFISHNAALGLKWKFFTMYTPRGQGDEPFVLISANPTLITADGDGKDDFTTFTMNAFDNRGIANWRLDIFNEEGVKVNNFGRTGTPPSTMKWDGSDKANNLLPKGTYYYQLVIANTGGKQTSSKKEKIYLSRISRAVTLEKSYPEFSPNNDGVKDTVNIEFSITDKSNIDNWEYTIMDQRGATVKTVKGYEFLPYDVKWDGKDVTGKVLPDGMYYMLLKVQYKDRSVIVSPRADIKISTSTALSIKTGTREFIPQKGILSVIPEISNKEVESWKLLIYASDNKIIKIIQGSEKLPEAIAWDGSDEEGAPVGYNLPIAAELEINDKAGNKIKSNRIQLWLDFFVKKVKERDVVLLFNQDLLHERKKTGFRKEADPVFEKLMALIGKTGVKSITVIAHTSSEGSTSSNLELSKERAILLAKMIKERHKSIDVKFKGLGKEYPYFKEKNSKWDSRYEIQLY